MYLIIALFAYALLALVTISDKLILSRALPKPALFAFYSSALVLPVWLLWPFGVQMLFGFDMWFYAIVAGLAFALALWVYYIGVIKSEVSHVGTLVGAIIPLFTLFLGNILLGETLSALQYLGVMFLVFGSLVVSFEKSPQHSGWHRGMMWGIAAGLLFALSHVASKAVYDSVGFLSGLMWTRGFLGVAGLLFLFLPQVRADLFVRSSKSDPGVVRHSFFLVMGNKVASVVGVVLVQYAIALGSVSVVNALNGFQYALVIILVAFFSKFRPRILKEEYTRGEIASEILAVALIAVGLMLLV